MWKYANRSTECNTGLIYWKKGLLNSILRPLEASNEKIVPYVPQNCPRIHYNFKTVLGGWVWLLIESLCILFTWIDMHKDLISNHTWLPNTVLNL